MDWTLKPLPHVAVPKGPVVIVVMDGIGVGRGDEADAVALARTPVLDDLRARFPWRTLKAHGTAVGLPDDSDMGNSEVGHNALGAGRVYDQGAMLVNRAIAEGEIFRGEVWRKLTDNCLSNGTPLHLIGLLSDGNVHSHTDHLFALIREAARLGIREVYVHPLLDGRDVPETSALLYIDQLEALLAEFDGSDGGVGGGGSGGVNGPESAGGAGGGSGGGSGPESAGRRYRIASGGGRMVTTMDRYDADWRIVERGWNAHVHGEARRFRSAREAIETFRAEQPGVIDQFLPQFVIAVEKDEPVGPIRDGASVIFFNYRGDRAIEISRAFEQDALDKFDRGARPKVEYAGMMQYDGDYHIPKQYLVAPPAIDRTMGEYLARNGIPQLACSETQKFGHVTYFWNGNRGGKFDPASETYVEIPSDQVPFEQRPWMKAAEITDAVIDEMRSGRHRLVRLNYPNGDMVGHTGDLRASILAVEAVDLSLGRLLSAVKELRGVALVTADHGNADDMYERDKRGNILRDPETGRPAARTSHSLNAVPFIVCCEEAPGRYRLRQDLPGAGLANVAATALQLLGFAAPEGYEGSLLED